MRVLPRLRGEGMTSIDETAASSAASSRPCPDGMARDSTTVTPDLGALYLRHRGAMHKVAASVLREAGRASEAGDAVHDAIVSIMASPPRDVRDWEAFLVSTAKRRALD